MRLFGGVLCVRFVSSCVCCFIGGVMQGVVFAFCGYLWLLAGWGWVSKWGFETFYTGVSGEWVCYSVDGRKGARVVEG